MEEVLFCQVIEGIKNITFPQAKGKNQSRLHSH